MAATTVNRSPALRRRIEDLGSDPARREAVVLGLVDALLAGDSDALADALDALGEARARASNGSEVVGWLDAAIAFAHWGLERAPSQGGIAQGTRAHHFLSALDGSPRLGSAELQRLLGTDDTQVSRTGRRLLESGLVTRSKAGRQVYWQLSQRGRRALDDSPAPPAPSQFWREAFRRGFAAAGGDEPGEPREVDPTRERIVERTLELHLRQGIGATTFEDVAGFAGVPMETVETLFSTPDELIRSCGQHFMEGLQLPPVDRAPEVFAGAQSETDRIHRLVETFFGAYERGADGIALARRERFDVVPVGEAMEELDRTLDALAAEALGARGRDRDAVASLRGLTDLEVWRALRHQGATSDDAVEHASAAAERFVKGLPARG